MLGICLGMQLLFDSSVEHGGARGPRPAARDASSSWSRRRQAPAHRLEPGAPAARVARSRRACPASAPSTTCTPSRPRPSEPTRRARHAATTASRSSAPSSAIRSSASSSTPRSPRPTGCALLAQLRRDLRARAGVILYPAIDILDGQAVRLAQGDFERPDRLRRRSAATPRTTGSRQGAQALHVVDLDGARAGEPRQPRARAGASSPSRRRARPGTAAGCAPPTRWPRARGRRRARRRRHGGLSRRRAPRRRAGRPRRDASSSAVDVRDGRVVGRRLDRVDRARPPDAVLEPGARGVRTVVYTDVDRDGMLSGPDVDAARRDAARGCGRAGCCTPAGSARSRTSKRWPRSAARRA